MGALTRGADQQVRRVEADGDQEDVLGPHPAGKQEQTGRDVEGGSGDGLTVLPL